MGDVEQVAAIAGSLGTGTGTEQMPLEVGQAQGMRESYATLRKMGTTLDTSMADLGRDSDRVVTLLAVRRLANLGAAQRNRWIAECRGGEFKCVVIEGAVHPRLPAPERGANAGGDGTTVHHDK